ncbi:uncharacterized protein si:ch73-364h19.1 isoform X2 [Osmerus eperlanus]|uniref:uncharacterized protein si:ch73-364h19.1 isoform X2 n=1 Tax=Osmerus eperlanus TaxID=29151 RepID=UPI002E131232
MSTGNTTTPSLRSDQLTIIVASFSSIVFFVVVVVLLAIVYRKDPLCCRARSYQASHGDMPGQLFYVGLPSSYRLPPLEDSLPRLPSYESVRKKDRQRHIHMMIADRFGLNSSGITEAPPTYEESIRQSMEASYDVEAATPPPEDPDTEPDALPGRPTLTPSPHDGPLPV